MNLFGITSLFVFISSITSEEVRSLCDDPTITAADRLPNNTYRVYRGNYYWELIGLPDRKSKVKGPFPAWYKYMAPVDKQTSVQTVIGGQASGMTYKFRGRKYWLYNSNGGLIAGGKPGFEWNLIPEGGFNAVLNDAKMGGKGYPIMIGFTAIKAYYYNTNNREFRRIGSQSGYVDGMNGEKFPPDLTAAFAFPSTGIDEDAKYYVYLFSRKRYCFRPIVGEDECKEWRNNTELFGCGKQLSNTTDISQPSNPEASPPPEAVPVDKPNDSVEEPPNSGDTDESPNNEEPAQDVVPSADKPEETSESGSSIGLILIVVIIVIVVVVGIVVGVVFFAKSGDSAPKPEAKKSGVQSSKAKSGVTPKPSKRSSKV